MKLSFFLFLIVSFNLIAQKDTTLYEFYDNKLVMYSDIGFNSAPFSINYPFNEKIDKLKYRNNYKNLFGIGCSYKWLSFRISLALGENAKPIEKYGKTNYSSLGLDFSFKKFYWDFDYRRVSGYAIKNAYEWNDSLSSILPNDIRANTRTYGFSINNWYFDNKNFKMQAVKGVTGHFTDKVNTWYVKNTFNIYGVGNGNASLIPLDLKDIQNSKTYSSNFSAVDLGVIPGYAYAVRKNNWQISGLFGLGAVLQNKIYKVNDKYRSFLGLAPRYDVRLVAGYSQPKLFVFLVTDFDNKSIRFNDLIYRQSFYSLKIVGGIRL